MRWRPPSGWGSASVRPPHQISIADGLAEALGEDRKPWTASQYGVTSRRCAGVDHRSADRSAGHADYQLDGSGAERASTSEVAELVLGLSGGPHEGASVVELSAELVALAGTPLVIGVRGVRVDPELRRRDLCICHQLASGDSAEVGFMVPPSWTRVVEAAPGRILVARLVISNGSLAGLVVQPVATPMIS